MPEFTGRLRTPRLVSAPSSPAVGELYYDTAANVLYWWNGTAWKSGSGGTQVSVGTSAPSPRVDELLWIDTDAAGPVATGGPLVTSLPAQPVDGQECYYVADATNGVVWHLIYRAADPSLYKWQCVGGSPLYGEVVTAQGFASTTYADLGTVGPSVTLPLGGDYDVEIGGQVYSTSATVLSYMSYAIGATAAVDADAIMTQQATVNTRFHSTRLRRKNGLAATTALVAKYRCSATNVSVQDRWLRATPVRVG